MHIPRAGGTALGSQIAQQTRLDPTFYFSFFGLDSSKGRNRIVVERLRKDDADHQALMRNRHFLESRVIMFVSFVALRSEILHADRFFEALSPIQRSTHQRRNRRLRCGS